MLTPGMRSYPYARSILIGLVYLVLQTLIACFFPDYQGIMGTGPWMAGGISLGFLAVEGGLLIPWVVIAHLVLSQMLLGNASVLERVYWPIVCLLVAVPPIFFWRHFRSVRASNRTRSFLSLALVLGVVGVALAAAGLVLLKTARVPSVVPAHALFAGLLGSIVPGVLAGCLCVAGLCCPDSTRIRLKSGDFLLELSVQVVALSLGAWLVALLGPVWWPLPMLALIWICLRHGVSGAAVAIFVLILASSRHRTLTLPNLDGFQPIMSFEGAVFAIGVGVGVYAEEMYRLKTHLSNRLSWMDSVMGGVHAGLWEWRTGEPIRYEGAWDCLCAVRESGGVMNEELWRSLVHPEDLDRVVNLREQHMRGHQPRFEADYRIRTSSGFYRWVTDRGHVVSRDAKGQPLRMSGICVDLSVRRQSEIEQSRRMEAVDSSQDPIAVADAHGNLCFANRGFRELRHDRGTDEVQNRHIADYFSEASAQMILRDALPHARANGDWLGEAKLVERGGRVLPVSLSISVHKDQSGMPRWFVLVARELARVKAPETGAAVLVDKAGEQQVRQESLRSLSGGVVHAINNVLMAVMGNAFLARKDLPADAPTRHFFAQIDQATERGSQFCHTLQLIAGRQMPMLANMDLNALMRIQVPMIAKELGSPERFVMELNPDLAAFPADSAQIERLLRHLMRNAAEAYGAEQGVIRIRTHRTELDPTGFASPAPFGLLQKGSYAQIEVADDGPGIDPAMQSRAFDPFFSTKTGHKGLGLAEVAGVAMGHGGAIRLVSDRGKGWLIQVLLPMKPPIKPKAGKAMPAVERWKGSGKVLVIDDEPPVRDLSVSMLEALGFTALVAGSAKEGLRVAAANAKDLRLVLLDYTLPDAEAGQTLQALEQLAPGLPVVFISGHGEAEAKLKVGALQAAAALGKPFTLEQLTQQLRQVLEKKA